MSAVRLQLMKWSLPALALVLGLLWYKKRRIDRADPGGLGTLDRTAKKTPSPNLCDSGINSDDSFGSNVSERPSSEAACTPRRVSESLDIPTRKSLSRSVSVRSTNSSEGSKPWYDEVEAVPEMREIQLGSNPRSTGLEMMSRSRIVPFETVSEIKEVEKPIATVDLEQSVPVPAVPSEEPAPECTGDPLVTEKEEKEDTTNEDQSENESKSQAQQSERDSANHSPVSGVLEGSITDEARSEGSMDSGKGGSIKGHIKHPDPINYEFLVPQFLVGKLIGKRGCVLQSIRIKADVNISVKREMIVKNNKICSIKGSQEGIAIALELIRELFPKERYPNLTLDPVSYLRLPEAIPWVPELMHLSLVEAVNNDVLVCNIVRPNRLFVQLPTHPTYPALRMLDENMTLLYNNTDSPPVPDELVRGMIVAAKWYNQWVRVYIENPDPAGERHLVRFVDHGGYWTFSNSDMRSLRTDYLTLPFQAIEVFLSNVKPRNGEWTQEAYDLVGHISSGIVGQAQIEGYVNGNVYVSLYLNIQKHGVISVADELIARGLADPIALEDTIPEDGVPISC
ncbi:KH domain-containing protein akap-1 [Orussus abietinus]|uniref:KH domain-containing protein akap-1 n=1 Tax=Orussus abietinus TaxID=222816 RepID=UPI0006253A9B|nr:KH domain-containing protein akap-1 [Orussus abietinus]XP_012282552.1 KH domain-containing protein akap-1 [Orussus abietinus]